ncbi:MAG: hypothetical protein KME42_19900 [Tildeniella nuda ZEHNDER 1965/U140]|jgi:hypothetical protein|nr:hypothetical protein [Tildeniella nuda ZEHNDER 1965/U140]
MENLAYLYILAEEAELSARKKPRNTQISDEKQVASDRSVSKTVDQPIDSGKAVLDCDRANPSYPTFYL